MDNNEIIRKAVDKMNSRGVTNYRCAFCGSTSFSIQSEPSTVLVTSEVKTIELKSYIPSLVFTCARCGHLDFFSLIQLEAIEKE
jgi:predicted nucleic-acid-binding Zn-ribbon protein